jgi:asparagine synthase (glutamine-hydrolysing)
MKTYNVAVRFSPTEPVSGWPADTIVAEPHFALSARDLVPPIRTYEHGGCLVAIWGSPAANTRIDDRQVIKRFAESATLDDFARSLNGSFLIFVYCRQERALHIITDRFCSRKLYYCLHDGVLHASSSFFDLLDWSRDQSTAKINEEAIFEFLYFRRLFGTKTYESSTHLLDAATILSFEMSRSEPVLRKYWQPDFSKTRQTPRAFARTLADGMEDALSLYTSDCPNWGLLLSGGLDSRAVLAAARHKPVCFTSCPEWNNEAAVAEEVANAVGAEYIFIPRLQGQQNDFLDDVAYLTNSEHLLLNTQFIGYDTHILPKTETVLTGLGLDVFFGGLYQPKKPVTVFGRQVMHFQLLPLSDDIVGDFLNGVKYRLRTSNPFAVVKQKKRAQVMEQLRASIGEILRQGRDLTADPYDLWEYMHLHLFSRHYSFSMTDSVRTFADCRTPALENHLFDLSLSMPPEYKANWTVYQRAIGLLSPAVMRIRNANTNVRAAYPIWSHSAISWSRNRSNRLLGTRFRTRPQGDDRSWPDLAGHIEESPNLVDAMRALADSQRLASLEFIDMDGVRQLVNDHEAKRHGHAIMLLHLVSIDRLLAAR